MFSFEKHAIKDFATQSVKNTYFYADEYFLCIDKIREWTPWVNKLSHGWNIWSFPPLCKGGRMLDWRVDKTYLHLWGRSIPVMRTIWVYYAKFLYAVIFWIICTVSDAPGLFHTSIWVCLAAWHWEIPWAVIIVFQSIQSATFKLKQKMFLLSIYRD